jgi:transposase
MNSSKNIDDAKRLQILEEHLSGASKGFLVRKYGISSTSITNWLRIFGIEGASNSPSPEAFMNKNSTTKKSAEIIALEKENKQLRLRLAKAEMAAKAYSTMIDLAEETYQIKVRKNLDTEQS